MFDKQISVYSPELICYKVSDPAMDMIPGVRNRKWMDETPEHYAYRCLPLSTANTSGWEFTCPTSFEVMWNGETNNNALTIRLFDDGPQNISNLIMSHFGSGILTLHTGWIFRTSPGWALWVRGAPNVAKDGIVPLEGVVETDWLPFTFTMNWKFTRSRVVRFEKGEPLCFITLCPHNLLDDIQPVIRKLDDDPQFRDDLNEWSKSRDTFNKDLHNPTSNAVAAKWQRTYFDGKPIHGVAPYHQRKRKLKKPV